MKKVLLISITFLSSCAAQPKQPEYYVSPQEYADYNCNQIRAEMQRVSNKREALSANSKKSNILDTALTAYAISQGYGYEEKDNSQLNAMNNTYESLDRLLIKKDCIK